MQIKYNKGICAKCGKDKVIVNKSKKLCLWCNSMAAKARTIARQAKRIATGKQVDKNALKSFYHQFWKAQHEHICFESGERLFTFRNWHIHHVLHKEDYPEHANNMDVCILLTLEFHALWHSLAPSDRAKKMPKTYERYLQLKQKYEL